MLQASVSAPPATNLRSPRLADSILLFGSALAVLFIISSFVFWKTTNTGFLLDDYLHVDYLNKAVHGDPSGILTRLYSRWSYSTDGLIAYRPGLTLSFWLDYALSSGNAFAMHATNIFLNAANSVLIALITVELSRALRLKYGQAIGLGAGLLFALYPLHPEATAWIANRADVMATFFYLLSILTFMLHAKSGTRKTISISVCCFLVSLTAKESTVMLPIVVSLLALFVYRDVGWKKVGAYWAALAIYGAWRSLAIGQLVGGYGDTSALNLKRIFRTFSEESTISKILFGATQEFNIPNWLAPLSSLCYGVIAACGLISVGRDVRMLRLYVLLGLWTIASILPAFQIWHIFPNLLGSRLFYAASAPFCMLLAYAAITPLAQIKSKRVLLSIGPLSILLLAAIWYQLLQINLTAWTVAGQQMNRFTEQIQQIAKSASSVRRALIVNIPQDYKGAPMLGRPQFLEVLCKPPFSNEDLASRICTLQRPIAGGHEYLYPELLQQARRHTRASYVWDETSGNLVQMQALNGSTEFAKENPVVEILSPESKKQLGGTKSGINISSGNLEVRAGTDPVTVWLAVGQLDPTQAFGVEIKFVDCENNSSGSTIQPTLVWRTPNGEQSIAPCFTRANVCYYLPGRQKNWALMPRLNDVGFVIPAHAGTIRIQTIKFTNDLASIEPRTAIQVLPSHQNDQVYQLWLTNADATTTIQFDATKISGCKSVQMFITKPWQAFDDFGFNQAPRKELIAHSEAISALSGTVKLPAEILQQPGVHQVAVIPINEIGKPCGILSEPRSFLIEAAKK